MDIRITDRQGRGARKQKLLDGRHTVVSRSGLNPAELQLIDALGAMSAPEAMLILGNRTGVCAMVAKDLFPDADVALHFLDIFHADKVRRNLGDNRCVSVGTRCEPFVQDGGVFDVVMVQATQRGVSGELLADLIQESHQALRLGGRCYVAMDGRFAFVDNLLTRLFGGFSIVSQGKTARCLAARKKADLGKPKDHSSEFTMTMKDRESVHLTTIPGVFAHRRVDDGAQALAEVVDAREGDALLDMGCGCGAVGVAIAKNVDLARAVFVDSHTRAVYATEQNCLRNDIANCEVVLSAGGLDAPDAFTVFVGNPPYFTDYRIAELFVRTAHRDLERRGRAYVVAKTAKWHERFMGELFGNAEVIGRRGYQIVRSVKS